MAKFDAAVGWELGGPERLTPGGVGHDLFDEETWD